MSAERLDTVLFSLNVTFGNVMGSIIAFSGIYTQRMSERVTETETEKREATLLIVSKVQIPLMWHQARC